MARRVIESDRMTDEVYGEIFASLLERVKKEDARASLLMFVSRWLERIGDRAVNLASRAIYIVEGRMSNPRPRWASSKSSQTA